MTDSKDVICKLASERMAQEIGKDIDVLQLEAARIDVLLENRKWNWPLFHSGYSSAIELTRNAEDAVLKAKGALMTLETECGKRYSSQVNLYISTLDQIHNRSIGIKDRWKEMQETNGY